MSWRTRDARAFADALDGARPSSGEIASLIAVAERICETAADVNPSPAFRASLRTSLMTAAATMPAAGTTAAPAAAHSASAPGTARKRRYVAIATAALATTFGLVGMTTASASALPGDTLYPVKRGLENTQLALKQGDSEEGTFRLDLAVERLEETNGLTERPTSPSALEADTLAEYSEQADLGSSALVRSFKTEHDRADIVTINEFATEAHKGLTSLEGELDGEAATALASAQKQLASIVETSTRLCPDCGGIDANLLSALTAPPAADAPAPPAAPSQPAPAPPAGVAPAPAAEEEATEDEEEAEDEQEEKTERAEQRMAAPVTVLPAPPGVDPAPSPAPPTPVQPPTTTPIAGPTANFTWSGRPGNGNELRVDFHNASSSDATTWSWDFGDNSGSSPEPDPTHEYATAGTYEVELTVTNAAGGTHAITRSVTVPIP